MAWAVVAEVACFQGVGWYWVTRFPSESRISSMTCGVMMTPLSAMADATMAICSGLAWVHFWPMDE